MAWFTFGSDDGHLYALTGTDSDAPHSQPTRRAVFWEASAGFNWFRFGIDEQIRDYFVREGYEKLGRQCARAVYARWHCQ
jgi:hypothetical protein